MMADVSSVTTCRSRVSDDAKQSAREQGTHLRGGHQARAAVIESWPRYAPGKEGHIVAYEFETLYRWANLNGFSLVSVSFTERHPWWRRFTSVVRPLIPLRTGLVLTLRHDHPETLYT